MNLRKDHSHTLNPFVSPELSSVSPRCVVSVPASRSRGRQGILDRSFGGLGLFLSSAYLRFFALLCSNSPLGGNRHLVNASLQLSATDVSARTTMKGAAKCDKHCDLQNSVNQQGLERILRFRDTPESMPASVSTSVSCCRRSPRTFGLGSLLCRLLVFVHQGALAPLMHEVYLASLR